MPKPTLTVAQRASLLRACHCEERKLLDEMEHLKDQMSLGVAGAAAKLAVMESELVILHSAIRQLWIAQE